MTRQVVMDMLRKPLVRPQETTPHGLSAMYESAMEKIVLERIEEDAMARALDKLRPIIDGERAAAKKTEMDLNDIIAAKISEIESMKTRTADIQRDLEIAKSMNLMVTKDMEAANARATVSETGGAELLSRIAEMEKRMTDQRQAMDRLTTELSRPKLVEKRPIPIVPDLVLQVTSRDQNGAIQLVSIKPQAH